MLHDAPQIKDILPGFLDFVQGSCLCSYNAAFDMGFLNNELALSSMSLPDDIMIVDILTMARRLLLGYERYALWYVAQRLGITATQEHRALSDVTLTVEVFRKLRKITQEKGIVELPSFLSLFGLPGRSVIHANNDKIARIQEAMNLGVRLKIKYLSGSKAEITEREVVPHEIKQEKNRQYLVGYCNLRKEKRSFRIDGILHVEFV